MSQITLKISSLGLQSNRKPSIFKTMKNYEKIEEVIDLLLYSEMGGEVDYSDPWYPAFKMLHELKEKAFEEEEGLPYFRPRAEEGTKESRIADFHRIADDHNHKRS